MILRKSWFHFYFRFEKNAVKSIDSTKNIQSNNILTIPKFPEHVCLTACVGLPGLPPSEPK